MTCLGYKRNTYFTNVKYNYSSIAKSAYIFHRLALLSQSFFIAKIIAKDGTDIMAVKFWNPSPQGIRVGDCAVRALAKVLDKDWQTAYLLLCVRGFEQSNMPNANSVIDSVLKDYGYHREPVPSNCKDCYTIADFAIEYPDGRYVVGTGDHVVAVVDGDIYDSWDSSTEQPLYFWTRKGE